MRRVNLPPIEIGVYTPLNPLQWVSGFNSRRFLTRGEVERIKFLYIHLYFDYGRDFL